MIFTGIACSVINICFPLCVYVCVCVSWQFGKIPVADQVVWHSILCFWWRWWCRSWRCWWQTRASDRQAATKSNKLLVACQPVSTPVRRCLSLYNTTAYLSWHVQLPSKFYVFACVGFFCSCRLQILLALPILVLPDSCSASAGMQTHFDF